MISSEFKQHKITVAQAIALKKVYDRTPQYARLGTHEIKSEPWYEGHEPLTFEQWMEYVSVASDCIMIPWCGMWLGIEEDGYTHS